LAPTEDVRVVALLLTIYGKSVVRGDVPLVNLVVSDIGGMLVILALLFLEKIILAVYHWSSSHPQFDRDVKEGCSQPTLTVKATWDFAETHTFKLPAELIAENK
jgi:hypothetical protein